MESKLRIDHHGHQIWETLKGDWHREDGPAVIFNDGQQSWYLFNRSILDFKEFQYVLNLSDEDMSVLILKYGWE